MTNLRVLHIHLGLNHGGAETFFVKLAGGLARRGVVQRAIVMPDRIWTDDLKLAGCEVVERPLYKGLRGLPAQWALPRDIAAFKPDALLAWMDRAARRVPKGDFVKVGRLGGYYRVKNYRNCDHLVANTPDIARFITESGWPAERTHVISNFPAMKRGAPIARDTLNTPDGKPLLVAMGRFEQIKGFDVLIRAVAQVPDVHLWILGEGREREALEALVRDLGIEDRVRLPGWIERPSAYFEAADIFVVPSRHEPLGNVLLEAWAMQKPVIAADSEGPSWLIQDGENGLLVPKGDAEAMAGAIRRYLTDPELCRRTVEAACRKLESEFSEEAICSSFIRLLSGNNP
ncbi:Glycosyltransferase involved in cell wall bisynthesis [Faunimonas pinastri]|uniref:Glycosyltransferase involved in cell wall bisynthesis n=1 Tax=Faunimonas pinastri TaxID=1855383 RepID=A0A1H9KLM0_9HYPH|nr:glycosyltransferase [Faunimonas pinastri]SER00044.1 Glycosyltransferase involved in cell wall bisynthesis [Faunimonas pinastri]